MSEDGTAALRDVVEATLTASRALLGVVARSLAGIADTVTPPQFRVLVLLASTGPRRMGDLAQQLGVHQSSFSRSADRMETAGWITRSPSPDSRREVLVAATESGLRIVAEVTEARRREIAAILARLSPRELDLVQAGFEAFARAAGEAPVEDTLVPGI